MILRELTEGCKGIRRQHEGIDWDMDVGAVREDSRSVGAGDIFVAIKGEYHDGHRYISQALGKGASAVVLEDEEYCIGGEPWILVENSREFCGVMEQNMAGKPSLKMNVVGVTGTNGKTTVAHMLAAIMEEAGKKVGLLSTVYNRIDKRRLETDLTTPGSGRLAELFGQMMEEQVDYAVMEVSSHALDQSRTAGIEYDLGIFTNLSQDHLDYHKTFDEYLGAKAKLFAGLKPGSGKERKKAAILNFDDDAGTRLADYCSVPVITYGLGGLCHVRAEEIELSSSGIRYRLVYGGESAEISLKLHGRFNVYNSLAAIAAALVEGVDIQVISRALADMDAVAGRFQQVAAPGGAPPFQVYVDYSHTPDSLEKCISTARELCAGRIISVFGAGGHRDAAKRPLMGETAARLSDVAIVTSDNPRDEDPADIIRDVLKGMAGPTARAEVMMEADRRKAICLAVSIARGGDMVLICGKGHEDYQVIGEVRHHFDDYEEAQKAIESCMEQGG